MYNEYISKADQDKPRGTQPVEEWLRVWAVQWQGHEQLMMGEGNLTCDCK